MAEGIPESQEVYVREPNPLLFQQIANLIIANLDNINDLKTARLVCKEWSKVGWIKLRSLSITYFDYLHGLDYDSTVQQVNDRLKSFIELFKQPSCSTTPTKFSFQVKYDRPDEDLLDEFFSLYGRFVTHLHTTISLTDDQRATLVNLQEYATCTDIPIGNFLPNIPSSLIFSGLEIENRNFEYEHLKEFLEKNPLLVKLVLETLSSYHSAWEDTHLVRYIEQMSNKARNLQSLELPGFWNADSFTALASSRLKLKSFSSGVGDGVGAMYALHQFLYTQRQTMISLKLSFTREPKHWPTLGQLRKLEVDLVEDSFMQLLDPNTFTSLATLIVHKLLLPSEFQVANMEHNVTLIEMDLKFANFWALKPDITRFMNALSVCVPNLLALRITGLHACVHVEACRGMFKDISVLKLSGY